MRAPIFTIKTFLWSPIFYGDFTLLTIGIIAVASLFPIWLFIYAVRELIKKTPHMTFTYEGLLIKVHQFYAWENIDDFIFGIEEVGRDNAGSIYKTEDAQRPFDQ